MNLTKHFKRNTFDKLVNYNYNQNVYRFARYKSTLTYEHIYNFLLFNHKSSYILTQNNYNKYCQIILQAEYFR